MEQWYPIYNRKYLAMVMGLQHWDYLLKETKIPVLVLTNHKNLEYHCAAHQISHRINGYNQEMQAYHVKICYKPGSTNRADTLSRQWDYVPDTSLEEEVISLPEEWFVLPNVPTVKVVCSHWIRCLQLGELDGLESTDSTAVEASIQIVDVGDEDLMDTTTTNDSLQQLAASDINTTVIQQQGLEPDILACWCRAHEIEEHPGGIWQKDQALVIVGNDDLKWGVTHLSHDSQRAGHPRITKTTEPIGQYYWWPGM
jgi:hypothetical protein